MEEKYENKENKENTEMDLQHIFSSDELYFRFLDMVKSGKIIIDEILMYKIISLLDENSVSLYRVMEMLNYSPFYEECYELLKQMISNMSIVDFKYYMFYMFDNMFNGGTIEISLNRYIYQLLYDILGAPYAFQYAYAAGLTRELYNEILDHNPNILSDMKELEQEPNDLFHNEQYGIYNNWMIHIADTDGLEIFIDDGIFTVDEIIYWIFNYLGDEYSTLIIQKKIIDLLIRKNLISDSSNLSGLHQYQNYVKNILEKRVNTRKELMDNFNYSDLANIVQQYDYDLDFDFDFFRLLYEENPQTGPYRAMLYAMEHNAINVNFIKKLIRYGYIDEIMRHYLTRIIWNSSTEVLRYLRDFKLITATELFAELSKTVNRDIELSRDRSVYLIRIANYLIDIGADIYDRNTPEFRIPSIDIIKRNAPHLAKVIEEHYKGRHRSQSKSKSKSKSKRR